MNRSHHLVVLALTSAGACGILDPEPKEHPDRAPLVAHYNATDGPNWAYNKNWLTDKPVGLWEGVFTADPSHTEGRVEIMHLVFNGLRGPIPAEIGALTELWSLRLDDNELSGPIPPEVGRLANLQTLSLGMNDLTGPIPPELGDLTNLWALDLHGNGLAGPIPPTLGELSNLQHILLASNGLTGRIPSQLGNLPGLAVLNLSHNQFTGELPASLTQLTTMYALHWDESGLCAPADAGFQAWLAGVRETSGPTCEGSGP